MKVSRIALALLFSLLFAGMLAVGCAEAKVDEVSAPSAPTGVMVTGENGQATINWSPVEGATDYNLYWSRDLEIIPPTSGTKIAGATAPYVHMGLTNGTTYFYAVTAVGPGGESQPSDVAIFTPLFTVTVPGDYSTIQAAINAVPAGSVIRISASHTEGGQILINKNVSIIGGEDSKPVIKPAANLPQIREVAGAWFLISSNITFSLKNVVIDGNGLKVWQAIRSHGLTTINNVDFRNIRDSAAIYESIAIQSYGGTVAGGGGHDTHGLGGTASTLMVINCTFQQIGRIGVLTKGTSSNTTIKNCTFTGKGDGTFLDYAFEVGAGGTATIENNVISNNRGVAYDTSTSAGILVTTYFGTGTSATITGNTISNSTDGIAVGYDIADSSVVSAHYNKFSGNVFGVNSTHPTVDATNNWWGNASGPHHPTLNSGGTGDDVSDHVAFNPWCAALNSCN